MFNNKYAVHPLKQFKKGKIEVQGVPKSQAAALPRHEKETDITKTSAQTNVRKALRLALCSPSEVIAMLKTQEQNNTK